MQTPLPEATAAFEKLKSALISAPVLAYFDVTQSRVLHFDACGVSIGAVLQQHETEDCKQAAQANRLTLVLGQQGGSRVW